MRSVYREKALQVMNEDSRQRIISRRVLTPKGASDGGGGGDEGGAARFPPRLPAARLLARLGRDRRDRPRDARRHAAGVAHDVPHHGGGRATRRRASDRRHVEIKVNKPLTLLAAFPRFLGAGDRASFGAVVTNTLDDRRRRVGHDQEPRSRAARSSPAARRRRSRSTPAATEPVRFEATARGVGTARVQMTVTLGSETDAFETTLPISAPAPLETSAAFGDTTAIARASGSRCPPASCPASAVSNVESRLDRARRPGRRRALPRRLSVRLRRAEGLERAGAGAGRGSRHAPSRWAASRRPTIARARRRCSTSCRSYQCADGGFRLLARQLPHRQRLPHELRAARDEGRATLGIGVGQGASINRALDFLDAQLKKSRRPIKCSGCRSGARARRSASRCSPSTAATRTRTSRVSLRHGRSAAGLRARRTSPTRWRPRTIARTALRRCRPAPDERGAGRRRSGAHRGNRRRRARRGSGTPTSARPRSCSTASCAAATIRSSCRGWCAGCSPRARNGRWSNTQENATALESLVGYYKKFEAEVPNMTATRRHRRRTPSAPRRSADARRPRSPVRLAMPDLLRQVAAGAERELAMSRAGTGRLYYTLAAAVRRRPSRRRRSIRACASSGATSDSSRTATARRRRRSRPAI